MNLSGIGNRIKLIRDSDSLPAFAARLRISKSTLVRYESEKSYPDAKLLLEICNLFSVNPNWLLTGEGCQIRVKPPEGFNEAHNNLRAKIDNNLASFVRRLSSAEVVDKVIPVEEVVGERLKNHEKYRGENVNDLLPLKHWGFERARKVTVAYRHGEYLPSDAELWTMCRVARFDDFESLRQGRDVGVELDKSEETKSQSGFLMDTQLLKITMELIEELQKEYDVYLTSEKKSEIVSILYEEAAGGFTTLKSLPERAHRLYKIAI